MNKTHQLSVCFLSLILIHISPKVFAASTIDSLNFLTRHVSGYSLTKGTTEIFDPVMWERITSPGVVLIRSKDTTSLSKKRLQHAPIEVYQKTLVNSAVVAIQGTWNNEQSFPAQNWLAEINSNKEVTALTECNLIDTETHPFCVTGSKRVCENYKSFLKNQNFVTPREFPKRQPEKDNAKFINAFQAATKIGMNADSEVAETHYNFLTNSNGLSGAATPLRNLTRQFKTEYPEVRAALEKIDRICSQITFADRVDTVSLAPNTVQGPAQPKVNQQN